MEPSDANAVVFFAVVAAAIPSMMPILSNLEPLILPPRTPSNAGGENATTW